MKVLEFIAILLTALMLVPTGAHFFELAHKIRLSRDAYFVVQQIYSGWSLFGAVLLASIVANLALTIAFWKRQAAFWFALAAFVLVAATLVIFFLWTYPANQATNNWTVVPDNWGQLRNKWEYSHATNAVLTFAALCSVVLAVLKDSRR